MCVCVCVCVCVTPQTSVVRLGEQGWLVHGNELVHRLPEGSDGDRYMVLPLLLLGEDVLVHVPVLDQLVRVVVRRLHVDSKDLRGEEKEVNKQHISTSRWYTHHIYLYLY